MIEVYEKKKVPENCSTCLYQSCTLDRLCGNANVANGDAIRYAISGHCPYYWLDQHRFTRAEGYYVHLLQ